MTMTVQLQKDKYRIFYVKKDENVIIIMIWYVTRIRLDLIF